ncbi:MAG: AEC family transporter, partial [Oscillospiraceae bacterium]|nr:AEC family transporter [Oscillospiraceae bacterium]
MGAVVNQLAQMVLMILIGYICAKVKISGPEFNKYTSAVLTNVLLPATILKSMTGLTTGVNNGEVLFVIVLFFLMMGIAGAIGKLASVLYPFEKEERGIILCLV